MSTKVALIVTIPIMLFMGYHYHEHTQADRVLLYHNAEMQLLRIAELIKDEADELVEKKDFAGLQTMVERASKTSDIRLVMLCDHKGRVIASNKKQLLNWDTGNLTAGEVSQADRKAILKSLDGGYSAYFDQEDVQYCLVLPINVGGIGNGVLYLSMDMVNTLENISMRAQAILQQSLFALFITIAVLYVLMQYILTRRLQAVSAAAVKIATGDLSVRSNVGGTDEIGYLAASFDVLADEISNWRNNLEEMVSSRVKELEALFDVVHTISQSLELKEVLPSVLDRVLDNMRETRGVIVLRDDKGVMLRLMAHKGLSPESIHQISALGQGCVGDVILKNDIIRIPGEDSEEAVQFPGLEPEGLQSAIVAPISVRGQSLGAIAIYSIKKDRFTDQDEVLLMTIGSQVGVAVENAQLYEKTLELAQKDGLTGLANRRFFMETLKKEVARADRYSTPFSILMLDIDKFKRFNDSYGHPKGDELLREFATMVNNSVRTTDTPGRYGGEEFVVILPNTQLKGAIVIAERIRIAMEGLKIPVPGESQFASTTVSIGIAELTTGETDEKILSAADAALYRAKEGGRNRVAW